MNSTPRTKLEGKRRTPREAKGGISLERCAPQLGQFPVLLLPTERAYFALLPLKPTQQPTTISARKEDSNP